MSLDAGQYLRFGKSLVYKKINCGLNGRQINGSVLKQETAEIKRPHLRGIRNRNRAQLLQTLRMRGTMSRQELSEVMDLTPASISRITKDLIAEGVCQEVSPQRRESQNGRPNIGLQINPTVGFVICASLSSLSRVVSMTDVSGKRHHERQIPEAIIQNGPDTIEFIGCFVDELIADGHLTRDYLLGAALVMPGSIDSTVGVLTKSVLVNWPDFPIKDNLSERLNCPARVENIGDALCQHSLDRAAMNGASGANIFLAHVAARMGASLALGGKVVKRLADEGWINDIPVSSSLVSNGQTQTLSQTASGRAILNAIPIDKKIETLSDLNAHIETSIEVSKQSDGVHRKAFYEAGYALGMTLLPLTIAFAPDQIVLAGPVVASEAYEEGARAGYAKAVNELDTQTSVINVNRTSYIEAAENLALNEHFFATKSPMVAV